MKYRLSDKNFFILFFADILLIVFALILANLVRFDFNLYSQNLDFIYWMSAFCFVDKDILFFLF